MNIYLAEWRTVTQRGVTSYGGTDLIANDIQEGELIITARDEYYVKKALKALHPKATVKTKYLGPA